MFPAVVSGRFVIKPPGDRKPRNNRDFLSKSFESAEGFPVFLVHAGQSAGVLSFSVLLLFVLGVILVVKGFFLLVRDVFMTKDFVGDVLW